MKFINGSIRNKIIFWMLISLLISSFTILTTTSQKISEDHLELAKQQLQLFSNTIFNQLRMKMAEGNTKELAEILDRAKSFKNVEDVKLHKGVHLLEFTKSKQKIVEDQDIVSVFALKIPSIQEEQINGENFIKLATPIIASNECLQCHTNQKDGDVVAVMEIVFSLDSFDQHSTDIIWNIVYHSIIFGVITILVLLFIIKRATEPIEGLKYGFQRLLETNDARSNVKLRIRTNDEIGDVAVLFNRYIDKLTLEFKKSTEKFAQNIMDAQSDIIVTLDQNRKIAYVNRAFLRFFDVDNLEQFIEEYGENFAQRFQNNDLENFISEYIDGVLWEVYIQENSYKIHKVILQNKSKEEIFTVSTNSVTFDDALYTTSVFTNINELETIRHEIQHNHAQLKTLFDNANEGFLYFDREMKIGGEYSLQAEEIFGFTLENKEITDLLFSDEEERNFNKNTLVSILDEPKDRQEILISLLKNEFYINHKFIEVQYKVINKDGFMLILTDITENKQLNEKIHDEQQVYKMVIAVVAFFDQFVEVRSDYKNFTQNIETFKTFEKLPDLRRELHTYKGLFAQLELLVIVKKLHQLENEIDNSIKIGEISDDIIYLSAKTLCGWLETDINIINGILKQDILSKSHVYKIEKERIDTLYQSITKYDDIELLRKEILKLTYKNIKDIFYGYAQLIRTLSQRLDKPMHELQLVCNDIYLSKTYRPFFNALVHIFRNSLDHGIESYEERELFGKDPKGMISCNVFVEDNFLLIHYKDDGKGIDLDAVRLKIIERNLIDKEQLIYLSQDEILQFIFEDGFSTSQKITDISGRGVGLSSLKNEVEKLNGEIRIINHPHEGVEFLFRLTLLD